MVLPSFDRDHASLPTFSMASARRSPITRSLLALVSAPTWAISFPCWETFWETFCRDAADRGGYGLLDAAANRHRVAAGHNVASALRGGWRGPGPVAVGRAIAGDAVRGVCQPLHGRASRPCSRTDLRAQISLLTECDAGPWLTVGATEGLVDDHIAAGGANGDGDPRRPA